MTSEHTAGHAVPCRNICADQSALKYCSGPCRINRRSWTFWTANCYYVIMKGWQKERTRNTGFRRTGGLCLGWLSMNSNKLTTYLLGVQEAARLEREIWCHTLDNSQDTRAHKYSAPSVPGDWLLYGGAYHLWVLSAEPGSCHSPGPWNFKLAPTFTANLCTLV